MLVKDHLSQDLVKRYLKEEYSIGCKFVSQNKDIKIDLPSIELTENLLIKDLINFYNMHGWQIKLFNSDGNSIPNELTIKEAQYFSNERSEDFDFKQLISSLSSISKTSNYGDIEWIKRLFSRVIKKAQNADDYELIEKLLLNIHLSNDKFLDSDLAEVKKMIK